MNKKIQIIKAVSFTVLLALVIVLLSFVFIPDHKLGSIMKEPDNSLDYLAIGNSECYTSISPLQLWKDYGFAGYNCGVSAQRIQDTYYELKGTLCCQSPKVVLLETDMVYGKQALMEETQTVFDHFVDDAVPFYKFHNQWKRFPAPDICAENSQSDRYTYMGMQYASGINPYTGGAYMQTTSDARKIGMFQHIYLNKIVKLCRNHGIELILYSAPSPRWWSMDKHNGIAAYAELNGLEYMDLNLIDSDLGIDWTKDTYDRGDHLNFSGTLKVTGYLGAYLHDRNLLPDRRADAAYSGWNDKLSDYLQRTGQTS